MNCPITTYLRILTGVVALLVLLAGRSQAAVQITLSPAGDSAFILQGGAFQGIAVLDLEIGYDPALMAHPQAERGGLIPADAIFNFNPSTPGQIRLFIRMGARAVSGSGTLATLRFSRLSDTTPASIRSLTANLVSVQATPVLASVQILSRPAVVESQPESAPSATVAAVIPPTQNSGEPENRGPAVQNSTTGAVPSRGVAVAGSIALPGTPAEKESEHREKQEVSVAATTAGEPPASQVGTPSESAAESAAVSPAKAVQPPQISVYRAVSERFKDFSGPWSAEDIAGLFQPEAGQLVRQEPAVALSDGAAAVTLRVALPANVREMPRFSLRNAALLTLEQSDDGVWSIGVKPHKGTIDASITVLSDGSEIHYPLVVVPPLDPAALSPKGMPASSLLDQFSRRKAGSSSALDLNGDGRQDYLDDFILSAHYHIFRQKQSEALK